MNRFVLLIRSKGCNKTSNSHHEGHKEHEVKPKNIDKTQRFNFVTFVYFVVKDVLLSVLNEIGSMPTSLSFSVNGRSV
jgi:hypothetical protein